MAYMLGVYVERDLNKAVSFFGSTFLGREKEVNSVLYSLSMYNYSLVKMICFDSPKINYEKYFYLSSKLGSEEASYFYGVNKYYRGEITEKEFVDFLSEAVETGFPLALFELYYISLKNKGNISSLQMVKVKKILLESLFFRDCDFYKLQVERGMSFNHDYRNRVKAIKNLNEKYFERCDVLKGY